MVAAWVKEEMEAAELADRRLNKRLEVILTSLGDRPTASIPAACGGYSETTAAYRFFDNEKVTFDSVLDSHLQKTRERMAAQGVVLVPQDTTEIDLTRPVQQVKGAGPLDDGPRRGVFLHALCGFTQDGTPLGMVHAIPIVREDKPLGPAEERAKKRKETPIEEKESQRWVETLKICQEVAGALPSTQVICLADSESDIYEVLVAAQAEPHRADWIVRACQNRAVKPDENVESSANLLRERAMAAPVLFTNTISVRGRKSKVACETRGRRQSRESRKAEVEVRAVCITLRPPSRRDRQLPPVTVNVVLVRESSPPDGEPPVEWLLLTNLPIDNAEQVCQVVQFYCVRWMIEVFFRTLKSGCRVEERLFEHIDRLLPCLAAYLIVAWRALYLCRLGRSCPDMSCDVIFEPAEWKSVCRVVMGEVPSKPPKLSEMVKMVAQLGGYVNRKRDDPPGPQTVWLGMERVHDFALCWQLFGPETAVEPKDV
jgi:hypothetical protein